MKTAGEFTEKIKTALGNNLVSVALYGSTAAGDQTRHFSDVNLFVLVQAMDVDVLKSAAPVVAAWQRQGHSPPMLFSRVELNESVDVFPIEFADIKDNHRILFGVDPFTEMKIKTSALRVQLEYELRMKLIQLRQKYMECEGNEKRTHELLARSLSSFTALARATLRLLNSPAPSRKTDVWRELSRYVSFDFSSIEDILHLREGQMKRVKASADDLFDRYLKSLGMVAKKLFVMEAL